MDIFELLIKFREREETNKNNVWKNRAEENGSTLKEETPENVLFPKSGSSSVIWRHF